MCTGACLAPAAQHWGEWALGRLPTILLLRGLPLGLLWLRNHLVYDLLRRGYYTYAYDMRMYANTTCNNNP